VIRSLLGFLIHHGNTDPLDKDAFYRIKDKILRRWGTVVGFDVQHLPGMKCNCCRNGYHWHWIYDWGAYGWEKCWHCGGTSWYKQERWILLLRYRLGNHDLHRPVSFLKGEWSNKPSSLLAGRFIEGFINHSNSPHHLNRECALWLFLFYDRSAFKKLITQRIGCDNIRTPFVFYQDFSYRRWRDLYGHRPYWEFDAD